MGFFVFFLWMVSIAISYFFVGGYLEKLITGYDVSRLSAFPLWISGIAILSSIGVTLFWASGTSTQQKTSGRPNRRRRFLAASLGSVGGVAAAGLAGILRNLDWYSVTGRNIFLVRPPYKSNEYQSDWADSRITEYRRLGRTDAWVSDISLGTGSSTGGRLTARVAREAIDRGMNYFDTAPDYAATGSEQILGEAMQGVRDQVFLATKFCTPDGHLGPGCSVQDYMDAVDASLQRMKTDHVDLVHIHSCNSVERLMDENAHEAFDRLRAQGKARFLGVSTHTPDLERIANAAIESDQFDVMMLAYHYGAWPRIGEIIDRAADNDIGVVAMKTLRGSSHQGLLAMRDSPDSFTQASFKWVLSNPSVSCLVISLWEREQIDEFFFASGKMPRPEDHAVLKRYDQLTESVQCRPHCGSCLSACPENLAIPDILRHRTYFENYGAEKEGMQLYSRLEKNAAACASCDAPCQSACPYGIKIPEELRQAHSLLSLNREGRPSAV
ncbi:MAG: aldo/keto reductase [Myxococcota bacterium]|nr:aldo/keto reductase [Myxococcota bacterium]